MLNRKQLFEHIQLASELLRGIFKDLNYGTFTLATISLQESRVSHTTTAHLKLAGKSRKKCQVFI